MELEPRELYDRASILRIRVEMGMPQEEELAEYMTALGDYDRELFNELYEANREVWMLEAEIGSLALKVRDWNTKRTEIKNKVSQRFGGGTEKKQYYAANHRDVV